MTLGLKRIFGKFRSKMRKKILVFGSSGMLGIEVVKELSKLNNFIVHATVRKTKDIKLVKNYIGEKKIQLNL